MLCKNRILKVVIERKMEETGRRGRRSKQPLDDLTETKRYCKLKEEALCGELALEESMDLSYDRLWSDDGHGHDAK
jgi:hypothetical protein